MSVVINVKVWDPEIVAVLLGVSVTRRLNVKEVVRVDVTVDVKEIDSVADSIKLSVVVNEAEKVNVVVGDTAKVSDSDKVVEKVVVDDTVSTNVIDSVSVTSSVLEIFPADAVNSVVRLSVRRDHDSLRLHVSVVVPLSAIDSECEGEELSVSVKFPKLSVN